MEKGSDKGVQDIEMQEFESEEKTTLLSEERPSNAEGEQRQITANWKFDGFKLRVEYSYTAKNDLGNNSSCNVL